MGPRSHKHEALALTIIPDMSYPEIAKEYSNVSLRYQSYVVPLSQKHISLELPSPICKLPLIESRASIPYHQLLSGTFIEHLHNDTPVMASDQRPRSQLVAATRPQAINHLINSAQMSLFPVGRLDRPTSNYTTPRPNAIEAALTYSRN
jgi:hypothetical protein